MRRSQSLDLFERLGDHVEENEGLKYGKMDMELEQVSSSCHVQWLFFSYWYWQIKQTSQMTKSMSYLLISKFGCSPEKRKCQRESSQGFLLPSPLPYLDLHGYSNLGLVDSWFLVCFYLPLFLWGHACKQASQYFKFQNKKTVLHHQEKFLNLVKLHFVETVLFVIISIHFFSQSPLQGWEAQFLKGF